MPAPIKISKGDRYHRLCIVREIESKERRFLCRCDCGNTAIVLLRALRTSIRPTKSCGCLHVETARKLLIERTTTHGLSKHPLYSVWKRMVARCHKPDDKDYENYGARGIKVCKQWRTIEGFLFWVNSLPKNKMYKPGLTLDRIENDEGYYPSNCRWATYYVQESNKRVTCRIMWKGKETPLRLVYDYYNNKGLVDVTYHAFRGRYLNKGWTLKNALFLPKMQNRFW